MTSSTRSTGKSTGPTEATIPAKPMTAAEAIAAARKSATHDVTSDNANVDELGYARVFDKNSLVGRPFTIIDWKTTLKNSDGSLPYTSCPGLRRCISRMGPRLGFTHN